MNLAGKSQRHARGNGGKRSKYRVDNSRAGKAARTVDGVLFASKAESLRYRELKVLASAGEITGLELQPAFRYGGQRVAAIRYTADFKYLDGGAVVIEEVKGFETRDYKLRRKLFLFRYGDQYEYRVLKV